MSPRVLIFFSAVCAAGGFQLAGALVNRQVPKPPVELSARGASAVSEQVGETELTGFEGDSSGLQDVTAGLKNSTLQELSQACEKAGSPAQTRLALMEAISKMKPEELQAMLQRETKQTDFYRSMRFDFQFAAKRLAEIAPEKAAALWLDARSSHYAVDILLSPWAKKDPQAFASWTMELPADAQRAAGLTLAQAAAANPDQFVGIAAQLAKSEAVVAGARGAIAGLIAKAGKGGDPSSAIAFAQSLPEGPARQAALAELSRWPKIDLQAHPEVAAALAQLSPSEVRRYADQIRGAAEVLPEGPVRDSAYASQFAKAAKKNVQTAAQSIEALANSPDYPAAVRGFVEATASRDPAAALEWALTIPQTGNQRSAALEKAAVEYFRRSPEEALKWVETAPLSPEEYLMLTGRSKPGF